VSDAKKIIEIFEASKIPSFPYGDARSALLGFNQSDVIRVYKAGFPLGEVLSVVNTLKREEGYPALDVNDRDVLVYELNKIYPTWSVDGSDLTLRSGGILGSLNANNLLCRVGLGNQNIVYWYTCRIPYGYQQAINVCLEKINEYVRRTRR
jgi:hypothetical protein